MLKKRLAEARLDEVPDPRDRRGRRWPLGTLLRSAVVGLVSGAQGLGDVERTTAELTPAVRRRLGIRRRVPDTTLRDTLCKLRPHEVRPHLHRVVRAAHRRKALSAAPGLPFGMVSLDGKATAVPSSDDFYAQRQTSDESPTLVGVVRTVTATLTSHAARPCIDVTTIPARTNEMGAFEAALRDLVAAYDGIDLFRLVSYDAGACSLDNAGLVRQLGLHYLFGLKSSQPTLWREADLVLGRLGPEQAAAITEDIEHGCRVVRRVYLTPVIDGFADWTHLRAGLRVESVTLDSRDNVLSHDNRYFVSSLPPCRLSAAQWLLAVRRHWGVETTHQILDVTFHEDDHPWIESNPRATAVVSVLRRIAYTLLALWRFVTLRADEQRTRPWRAILHDVFLALLTANEPQLAPLPPLSG
jgi:hypothetical protein